MIIRSALYMIDNIKQAIFKVYINSLPKYSYLIGFDFAWSVALFLYDVCFHYFVELNGDIFKEHK